MSEIKADNRYGLWKYGEAKYGASEPRDVLAWGVLIDWEGTGTYTNEAPRLIHPMSIQRGRKRLLKPNGQGFERIPTGTASITLNNHDGRYDAWNRESPLYPNVEYGKTIKILVRDLSSTDANDTLFTGTITDIRPFGYGENARVTISCADGLEHFRNNTARVEINENITPNAAIEKILDSVNWQGGRVIDENVETIRYWWASGSKQAATELSDLADSFLGYLFCTVDNEIRYIQRTAVSDIAAEINQTNLLKDIDNPQPYEIRRNITRIKVRPRLQSSTVTIWETIGDPIFVNAGSTRSFFADYSYLSQKVPAVNVAIDVYEANSNASFTGTDLTTDASVSIFDFGDTAKIDVTNNGATGFYFRLVLEGNAIYEESVADIVYPSDITTITSPRELIFDLLWQQNPNVAIDLSVVLGQFYSSLKPTPNVKIENIPSLQFGLELFDIVEVNLPYLGLQGETLRIGGIEHRSIKENCQSIVTRLYLEPYVSGGDFMQWDTNAEWDTSTIFGY